MNKYILGIDLGTSNTCAGIWNNNNFELIYDKSGNSIIPSVISFTDRYLYDKSKYIGNDAKNQLELNPENTYYEIKRIIGREYSDGYVQELINSGILGYHILNNNNRIVLESSYNYNFSPEEITAYLLAYIKQLAQIQFNEQITECVITIPSNFNDNQKQATINSAKIAGLNCLRLVQEPIAGALAYGFYEKTKNINKELNILVVDFGGGTLDVSIVNIDDGIFDVIGSSGFAHFGGSDFDTRIMNFCLKKFNQKHNLNISESQLTKLNIQKLKTLSENAKKTLSTEYKYNILIKNFYNNLELNLTITQDALQELFYDLTYKCFEPIIDIIQKTNLSLSQIDDIILIGGMTKFTFIKSKYQQYFQRELNNYVNPDYTVAMGAAIQGYIIYNEFNNIKSSIFSNNITLLNKTSLSIGIEINNGIMDIVIPHNTNIPYSIKKYYTSDTDFIDNITIKIFEGERKLTKDNYLLGSIILNDLPKQLKGILKIGITFSIDNNGLIQIIAEEESSHIKEQLLITYNRNRLSDEEIEHLIKTCMCNELQDEIDLKRKMCHTKLYSLCNTIINNLDYNTILNISESESNLIKSDINNIISYLNDNNYCDISLDSYDAFEQQINSKYLYLTNILVAHELKSSSSITPEKTIQTSIYDNQDLLKYKSELTELCDSLLSALCTIESDKVLKLKSYINDALLWLNLTDTTDYLDYKFKIDDINKISEELYNDNPELFNKSNIQLLEEKCLLLLCYTISDDNKSYIENVMKQIYTNTLTDNTEIDNYLSYVNSITLIDTQTNTEFVSTNTKSGTNIVDLLKKQNEIN